MERRHKTEACHVHVFKRIEFHFFYRLFVYYSSVRCLTKGGGGGGGGGVLP